MSNIRVRWAPSNTGPDVHLGNVRTILFNYLFAKKNGGTTVFRIEDSDVVRSKQEYADAIAASLDWLGLRADEGYKIGGDYGPYLQTQKLDRYKQLADELIEQGLAYRCYCTQDELNALRNALPEKQRQSFRYPGICRDKKDYLKDKDYVIRLKTTTEGSVEWDDMVFGHMAVPNKENFDWVLMRGNGVSLYNFGCVIDDVDQNITHIIRGRDHIVNTPIQIHIYNALGKKVPTMAHLPMMLGQDGAKLSKRHASVSVDDYRKAGYTPSGILNYLLRFGFGYGNQEIFSIPDMIDKFSLEACGKNDGKFDPKKFSSIQFEHLKSPELTSNRSYADYLAPHLWEKDIRVEPTQIEWLIPLVRTRSKTLLEAVVELEPIFKDINVNAELATKFFTPETKETLKNLTAHFNTIGDWSEAFIKISTIDWLTGKQLTIKDISQPMRVAITGRTNSPDLFQIMAVLGKEKTINRLTEINK